MSAAMQTETSEALPEGALQRTQAGKADLPFHRSLRFRLILSVALVHIVLMGAFTWVALQQQSESVRQQFYDRGRSLASLMAATSTNEVLAEDLAAIAEITHRVGQQTDVRYNEIVDARGQVLASTRAQRVGTRLQQLPGSGEHFPLRADDQTLDMREDIRVAGRVVGVVLLGLSTTELDLALKHARYEALAFILAALVIGSLAAWGLSLAVTRHLQALTRAARRISDGDYTARVPEVGQDEAGLLARAFNAMAESLQRTSAQVHQEYRKRTEAERLACVGELSASIAHEIRNPLSAVINSVKLLERPDLPHDDRDEVVNIIDSETRRLQRILSDFLEFARIREPHFQESDLCRLVQEVAGLVEQDPRFGEHIQVCVEGSEPSCRARFDTDQIRQVLWNLMLNAAQAMPDGGEIAVRWTPSDYGVRVRVTDTGCGIDENFIGEVTKPFVTGRRSGTGLGLAIAQRVLVQHGSSLMIHSRRGAGTEVSFELPSGEARRIPDQTPPDQGPAPD